MYSRLTLCYPEKERQIWGPLSCQVLSFLGVAPGGNGLKGPVTGPCGQVGGQRGLLVSE